ncbi:hypothetical protein N7475_001800 [Penicillium sp. IBT 31633x]|nr:hypothetical protein N7475_001800 [Penicillium sp. IBT 31633x]
MGHGALRVNVVRALSHPSVVATNSVALMMLDPAWLRRSWYAGARIKGSMRDKDENRITGFMAMH